MVKKVFLVLSLSFLLIGCQQGDFEQEKTVAIAKARTLFKDAMSKGVEMSSGPCLSNELIPGWVADVAHKPRQAIDDLVENQCSAFREGKAQHFV